MSKKILLLMAVLGVAIPAQTVVEHTFATPLPIGFEESPIFTSEDAVAFAGNGELHWISGLPDSPVHQFWSLDAGITPASPWSRLAPSVGVYVSITGQLVIVSGLPATPLFVGSGLIAPASDWIPVNHWTAVAIDEPGQRFHVFRHTPFFPSLVEVVSPVPLSGGVYEWGRLDDDALIGLGTGPDGVSGTSDDEIVHLSGLAPPSGAESISTLAIPGGGTPRGFVVTPSGVGAFWEDLAFPAMAPPSVDVTLVRAGAAGLEFVSLTVNPSLGLGLPQQPGDWGLVRAGPKDSLHVVVHDDVALVDVITVVKDVSTIPVVAGSVTAGVPLTENEFVTYGEFGGPVVTLTSLAGASPLTTVAGTVGDAIAVLRPNPATAVVFGAPPHPEPGYVTLVHDPYGTGAAVHQPLSSTVSPFLATAPVALGPGRVAWFTKEGVPPFTTGLGVMTLPLNDTVGPPRPEDRWLTAWPPLPSIDDDLILQVDGAPPGGAWAFVSPALLRSPMTAPSLGPSEWLEIDPAVWFPPLFLPNVGWGLSELVLPLASLPPGLRGVPLYVQAFRDVPGGHLSQALLLSIG